jgi:hypothetical protein
MQKQFLAAAVAALTFVLPVVASAQDQPPDQQPSYSMPSYAQQGQQDEQIRGRISSFDGAYSLTVNDERGFVDNVQLHNGTIINPTGITLQPGMVVSILGYNAGSYFAANEVDTPYTFYAGVPYYYGHPWFYWGPAISLGFFFGNYGWWHGGYFRGGYHYYGGGRVYVNAPVRGVYRNGTYQGRSYVVPASRGGYVPHGGGGGRPPHRP